MSSPKFEEFLVRLYTNGDFRERFLENPYIYAKKFGLAEEESKSLEQIDKIGLALAARSYEHKRKRINKKKRNIWKKIISIIKRIKMN
ncbi:MAG: hypothetical protein H7A23_05455 [Leptospiraceae bacterium]|nr:hypothetical protein [Leptospiraceae bacterium]MCP5493983.1 hypothetical protein [Leptospiraceae bacterium]